MVLAFLYMPDILETVVSVVTVVALASGALSEACGKNMQYSKFVGGGVAAAGTNIKKFIPSRTAMVSCYASPFIISAASLGIFPGEGGLRFLLLKSAITVHFLKRLLESLFLHKYSGGMTVETWINICVSYMGISGGMIYFQHRTVTAANPSPSPTVDLKWAGIVLFAVGISGNFYHHYLLAKLRSSGGGDGEIKWYKIPRGGMFELVVCPHYLFEIVGFFGVAFIAQACFALSFAVGSALFLCGRSVATRRWYLSKFDNFPKHVGALLPYLF